MSPRLVTGPQDFSADGKTIEQFVGGPGEPVSVARMVAPGGWSEPGQTPEFDEVSVVLRGALIVEHRDGRLEVAAGQAVVAPKGEWVRYSTEQPSEYIAVCLPAFSPDTVHRDE